MYLNDSHVEVGMSWKAGDGLRSAPTLEDRDGGARTRWRRSHIEADLVHASRPLVHLLPELALGVTSALAYFAVRGLMSNSAADAVDHARALVRLEKACGFYWESAWQDIVAQHHVLVTFVNWIYIYAHWPVILAVAIWLMRFRHTTYIVFRNAFLISGFVGLCVFVLYPVAPPRLAGLQLVDTITQYSNSYRVLQPPGFVNQYAAFPSLHFGWNLLAGIALYRTVPNRAIHVVALTIPALMFFAIVATANHFIIDAVAGGMLSLLALAVAARIAPRDAVEGEAQDAPVS
jgi:hypothetical protein